MRSRVISLVVVAAMLGSFLAACASSSTTTPTTVAKAPLKGGTVTVAYLPDTLPVYIFPMFPATDDTCQEIFWFVEQFWPPLYWFGNGGALTLNPALSIAYPPVFSNGGRTVTIKLKHWEWSDGTPVTTRDVEFWMNLLSAEKQNYADYIPGNIPDDITSIHYSSSTTFSITFNARYNPDWLWLNQLSLLFAIPQHVWDKTSATGTVGNYDLTPAGAKAVFNFLNSQSETLSTYPTNPLWQVVDGPFRLSNYVINSEVVMVPNSKYSGPVKPKVSKIEYLNFTSDAAEYDALLSGSLDYGYVPFNDVPSEGRIQSLGYTIIPWPQAGMNYLVYNYTSPSAGALFRQLYIRQALQHLVDQQGMIKAALYGDGVPTYGPVPAYKPLATVNGQPLYDSYEQHNLYPYSISDAISLLRSHGWTIHPSGVDVCTRPGTGPTECGAGIPAGKTLSFRMIYPTGIIQEDIEMEVYAGDASRAGVSIHEEPVPNSVAMSQTLCTPGAPCNWDMDYVYLGGWQYGVPINYPDGILIFGCGGPYTGGYCSKSLDSLMLTVSTSSAVSALYPYENFLTKNVPVLWLPLQPYQFSAVKSTLQGETPQNAGFWIFPQYWYFVR